MRATFWKVTCGLSPADTQLHVLAQQYHLVSIHFLSLQGSPMQKTLWIIWTHTCRMNIFLSAWLEPAHTTLVIKYSDDCPEYKQFVCEEWRLKCWQTGLRRTLRCLKMTVEKAAACLGSLTVTGMGGLVSGTGLACERACPPYHSNYLQAGWAGREAPLV